MTTLTAEILEIYVDEGLTYAKVRVGKALMRVLLLLLMDARVGDRILIESGVALSRVDNVQKKESADVPRDTR